MDGHRVRDRTTAASRMLTAPTNLPLIPLKTSNLSLDKTARERYLTL
jgi:hypothetical protein